MGEKQQQSESAQEKRRKTNKLTVGAHLHRHRSFVALYFREKQKEFRHFFYTKRKQFETGRNKENKTKQNKIK